VSKDFRGASGQEQSCELNRIECCSLCDVLTAVKEHDIHVCYCHYDLETAVMSLTYLCFFSWLYSHSYQRIMWTIIGSDCMLMANPTSGLALS